jgi:hypothetical protein
MRNTWLICLIWISCHRWMQDILISNIIRHGRDSGLMTDTNLAGHVWKQKLLQWHQTQCNWIFAWNKKLEKYVKAGKLEKGIWFLKKMQQQWIIQSGYESKAIGSSLIHIHGKSGSMDRVDFESVQQDAFTWCHLIECYHICTCEMWARKSMKDWINFTKCNRKVGGRTLLLFWQY